MPNLRPNAAEIEKGEIMKFSLWVIFLIVFNYVCVYRVGHLFGQIDEAQRRRRPLKPTRII